MLRERAWALLTGVTLAACQGGASIAPPSKPRSSAAAASARPPVVRAPPPDAPRARPEPPPGPPLKLAGGAKAVSGRRGVVSSVEAQATRAGIRVLAEGGNAVDAAVAIGYALAVTHPSAGNIGGGGFMLVRPAGGETSAFDFRETAPRALTQERFDRMIRQRARGPAAVGIPGSVAGLELAHDTFGRLPRARVLAPAIELARDGYVLGARQAKVLRWAWRDLARDPGARKVFGNAPPRSGARLENPELAQVLEPGAEQGAPGFYSGETARLLVQALEPAGVTLEDFAAYRALRRQPLRTDYRGLVVETMPPPSAGGVVLVQLLGMLQALGAHEKPPGSAQELHLFVEASRRAQAERRFAVTDPEVWPEAERAARLARLVDAQRLLTEHPIDPEHATASAAVHPLYPVALKELEHTTHFSVADADGSVVACTMTLSASFGAKLVAPGTGIVLNNAVASFGTAGENVPRAGRRTTSSMAPTLVLRGAAPVLVLGSPGGDTIPSTVSQVLRRVVDHAMPLDAAVDAPRVHHGFAPDKVRTERDYPLPKDTAAGLRKLGHALFAKSGAMGNADVILLDGKTAYAYADPREGGLALAVPEPGQ